MCWIFTCTKAAKEVELAENFLNLCSNERTHPRKSWPTIDHLRSFLVSCQSITNWSNTCPKTTILWSLTNIFQGPFRLDVSQPPLKVTQHLSNLQPACKNKLKYRKVSDLLMPNLNCQKPIQHLQKCNKMVEASQDRRYRTIRISSLFLKCNKANLGITRESYLLLVYQLLK